MGDVHVEMLEFGQPVPEGGFLIPYPRKADGTPLDREAGYEAIARIIADPPSQGHDRIFVELPPHA